MNKAALTLLSALVTVTLLGDLHSPVAQQRRSPNVLLIQADDLGYGDLSAYGQAQFQTPALDRLAKEGVRFTQYYAGSTVCAPSRTALMTGLHTGHAWIRGNGSLAEGGDTPLRPEDVTVAEVLQAAGYRTAVIGKWGLGQPGTTGQPDRQGFEHAFGFLDHRHAHRQYTDHLYRNGTRVEVDLDRDYVNDLFTREAAAFIARDDRRPFFVYLNYTVPHAELRAPDEAIAPFRQQFPEQAFANAAADRRPAGARPEGASLGYRSQPEPHAAFAAMITRMDRDIGRLADLIRARGIERETLILFISDNGPHQEGGADPVFFKSSGGLRGIKRDLYEGGIRVPMIARWTGTVPAGRVSDHPWAHWDVLPTLAEFAGAPTPAGLDGLSMIRALRGQAQPTHDFFYWEFHERGFQQAVRMGRWKAVRLKPGAPLELYDLESDPYEQRNVAATQADVVARIEKYLETARTESKRWPGAPTAPRLPGAADFEEAPFAPKRYVAYRTPARPAIDGKLDEPGWVAAPWTDVFVDIEGDPTPARQVRAPGAPDRRPAPRYRTRAKMLWDDDYFYIGAEMEEPDVWATLTERDSVIFRDNDFEVFIDPDGDTHAYYELEVNALNTVWDLMLIKPYRDGGPAINGWDIAGLQSAVDVRGTINRPGDKDEGWSVEIAMPWTILREASASRKTPQPGDRWRVNFSRVQWDVDVVEGRYVKRLKPGSTDPLPEHNWVWSPQGAINMHMPERWGYVQFSRLPAGRETEAFVEDANEPVKWALRRLYYRQRAFRDANRGYAATLDALGPLDIRVEGLDFKPVMHSTQSLYEITAAGFDGRVVHINQDGRVWLTP
jgi:arylsulfatase A